MKLPWPDDVATYLKIAVDEEPRKENTDKQEGDKNKKIMLTVSNKDIRLTVMRYCVLYSLLEKDLHQRPELGRLIQIFRALCNLG